MKCNVWNFTLKFEWIGKQVNKNEISKTSLNFLLNKAYNNINSTLTKIST